MYIVLHLSDNWVNFDNDFIIIVINIVLSIIIFNFYYYY